MTRYIDDVILLIVLFFNVKAFLWISYCVFILPGQAKKFKSNNLPVRELSLDEYRILKRYYPKEKFSRNVWEHNGTYGSAATWGDVKGREVISGVPVVFHSGAEEFLRHNGENNVQIAIGKKKAYVISLNGKYSITGSARKVEAHERFWDQWKMGLPGAIEGHEELEIVGQRNSTKHEQFHQVYRHAPEFVDGFGLRLIGVLLTSIGLIFSWLIYYGVIPQDLLFFVADALITLAGAFFIFLPAHAMSREEKVNIIRGKYKGLEKGGVRLGRMKFRIDGDKKNNFSKIAINKKVTIDVCVMSNMVIGVDNKSFFQSDSLSNDKEPKGATFVMMLLSCLSASLAFNLDVNSNLQSIHTIFVSFNSLTATLFLLILLIKLNTRPSLGRAFSGRKERSQ